MTKKNKDSFNVLMVHSKTWQWLEYFNLTDLLPRHVTIFELFVIFQTPEEIQSHNLWEQLTGYAYKLLAPFQVDPAKVPVLPKKFTCVFERDKEYL